jgi:hypothetical protein
VPGRDEDARRVVDADHLIQRRVHDQHRPSQEAMAFSTSIPSTASRNPRRMRKGLPAISTEASPSLAMVSRSFGPKRRKIC